MKFPETLRWECTVCDAPLDLPASAMPAPSQDPRYMGFMVIVEQQAALDHMKQAHGVG